MQIQAFFDRIGYTGDTSLTLSNLQQLVRCHLETVPFENNAFYNNPREMSLKPEDLYDKVVNRRLGGVCFELNGLFHWLLNEIGYKVYPVSVRISMFPGMPAAITHQGNVVVLDGRRYYCDVGFGGPGPKGVLDMDEEAVQVIDGEPFRVTHEGVQSIIHRMYEGEFTPILRYTDVPSDPADFPILFYFFCANPNSRFVTHRVVNLCLPDGYLAISENEFSGCRGGEKFRRVLETEDEVKAVMEKEFGLKL